uniref:deoxyribose-phosphate aldolase n=1 Tax=Xenopus tropicalis TaxID=8364 RepID=A0A803JUD6_XENTR
MSGRNPGTDLDLAWISRAQVNQPAVLRRAEQIQTRRTVKKDWQAAWLLRAVTCIDLTTLSGDDTPSNIHRLCFKAKRPIRDDLLQELKVEDLGITNGAVCVYPARVGDAVRALKEIGCNIPVASVATGFPAGQTPLKTRLEEVRLAVEDGASEIDIVINRTLALTGQWEALYKEIRLFRQACGDAHMKTILGIGELGSLTNVYRASLVAMMAGTLLLLYCPSSYPRPLSLIGDPLSLIQCTLFYILLPLSVPHPPSYLGSHLSPHFGPPYSSPSQSPMFLPSLSHLPLPLGPPYSSPSRSHIFLPLSAPHIPPPLGPPYSSPSRSPIFLPLSVPHIPPPLGPPYSSPLGPPYSSPSRSHIFLPLSAPHIPPPLGPPYSSPSRSPVFLPLLIPSSSPSRSTIFLLSVPRIPPPLGPPYSSPSRSPVFLPLSVPHIPPPLGPPYSSPSRSPIFLS